VITVTSNTAPDGAAARASADGGRLDGRNSPPAVPKASDVLADDLRERILSGDLEPGTALPPERELVVQTQVSRATVREALRILEVQGLLDIRTGRSGGAFVRRPDRERLAGSVELFVRGRHIRLAALLETREAIEPTCAALAAGRRTASDLERLRRCDDRIDAARGNLADFLAANVDWHVAVADASHNELLSAFMHSISRALYSATANAEFVDADVRDTAVRAHLAITTAIADGDVDAARRRMERHVHAYATAIVEVETRAEIALEPSP
jgi:DNA-binding FadR family transcriptional regulator